MVVLPTPPEPQQTMIPVPRVVEQRVDVERRRRWSPVAASGPTRARVRVMAASCHPLALSSGGQLVEAAEVDAAGQPGQLVRRDAELGDQLALGVLERPALGVVAGLAEQPVDAASSSTSTPAALEVGRDPRRGRASPARAAARSSPPRSRGPDQVDDHAADRAARASRSSAIPSAVSCTGISSSTVTRCTAVRGERNSVITVSAWFLIGPTLASPASSLLTLRNWVIRPVGGASSTTASYSTGASCCGRCAATAS